MSLHRFITTGLQHRSYKKENKAHINKKREAHHCSLHRLRRLRIAHQCRNEQLEPHADMNRYTYIHSLPTMYDTPLADKHNIGCNIYIPNVRLRCFALDID